MRHSMLRRQLARHLPDAVSDDPRWTAFLDAVDRAYHDADRDRSQLERSLDLTSGELFERNQALHEAMSGGDVAIWSIDADGTQVELQGYPLPFVRGPHDGVVVSLATFLSAVGSDDRERVAALVGDRTAERLQVRAWFEDARGRRRLELRGQRASTGHIGIAIDVTHQHEAEERQRRLEQHQRVLVDLARALAETSVELDVAFAQVTRQVASTLAVARVGVWLYDRDSNALVAAHVHDRGTVERGMVLPLALYRDYERALRGGRLIAAADALQHPATRAFGADYLIPTGVGATLDAMIFRDQEVIGVLCHEHLGGPRHWTAEEQAFAASVADLLAVALESHRRRAAELALAEQQRLLRTVIDTAPNVIFAKDRGGRFTLVNRAMAALYGTTVDELVGKTDADFNANAAELERFRQDDAAVLDTLSERVIAEESVTDAAGVTRWFQTVKRPLLGADGRAELVLGIVTDISERKRAELARIRLDEKMRQSHQLESLGLLAGGIAHDFNNLLTPILAYAEVSETAADLELGDLREFMTEIKESALLARDLTAQLLAFGRKQALLMTAVDLNEEIRRLVSMLRRVLPADIDISTELDPDLPNVRGDGTQVHQILMNLAVNARDAMPDGGRLRFATCAAGDVVTLTVEDTGHGMNADTLGQIFEPFFTTKELGRGTGLGLATVYGVVKQHEGTIDVESALGVGTRFVIRLPVAASRQLRTDRARTAPGGSARCTVLVVEDDPRVLRLTCALLARRQVDVLAAHGPERALELARSADRPIDLLLTDVIMPGMNGRELHRRLAAEHGDLPVLYMTGYSQDVLGADGVIDADQPVLGKPFTADSLYAAIDRARADTSRVGPRPRLAAVR